MTTLFHWLCFANLIYIIHAEALFLFAVPEGGFVAYILLLCWLPFQHAMAPTKAAQQLTLRLLLIPVARLVALGFPLEVLPPVARQASIYVFIYLGALFIDRREDTVRSLMGIASPQPIAQCLFALGGVGLGMIAYAFWQPGPVLIDREPVLHMVLLSVSLTIFTGWMEEWLFRGLIQEAATRLFGWWGVIYVALLYTTLQVGYASLVTLGIILLIALLFGSIAYVSRSIYGTALAHSAMNVMAYLILPTATLSGIELSAMPTLWWVIGVSTLCSLLGLVLLLHRSPPVRLA